MAEKYSEYMNILWGISPHYRLPAAGLPLSSLYRSTNNLLLLNM